MYERFTDEARQVVVLAQQEARALCHGFVGTEHLLLGLLREDQGLAARVLRSLGLSVERARDEVVQIAGYGAEQSSAAALFTPRAKKVLELALREALSAGDNYIGTDHILLGLVRENTGVAARILLDADADATTVHGRVVALLSDSHRRRAEAGTRAPGTPAQNAEAHEADSQP